jgi:hypothetical protein
VPIDIGDPADRVVLPVIGAVGSAQALPMTIGYFAEHAAVATGLVVWSVAGGLVFVASRKLVRSPIATEIIGGVALVAGAAITGVQSVAFATLFGSATAAALIALGTQPGRVLLSLFGSLGLLVNVPWAIRHFFPAKSRAAAHPGVRAVIVLVAVWLARMSGRLRANCGTDAPRCCTESAPAGRPRRSVGQIIAASMSMPKCAASVSYRRGPP